MRRLLIALLPLPLVLGHVGDVSAHGKHRDGPVVRKVAATPGPAQAPASLKFEFGGPFSLIDHRGRRRTDADFRGRFMMVFFGYAQCQSICPVGLARMARALDALGPLAERIQPIFITVDPDNDTPDVLAGYVAKIHRGMVGLTGTKAELRAAARAYHVETKLLTEPGDKAPIYAHGSFIFLMKPDGKFATLFPPVLGPEAIAASVRRYLR